MRSKQWYKGDEPVIYGHEETPSYSRAVHMDKASTELGGNDSVHDRTLLG